MSRKKNKIGFSLKFVSAAIVVIQFTIVPLLELKSIISLFCQQGDRGPCGTLHSMSLVSNYMV